LQAIAEQDFWDRVDVRGEDDCWLWLRGRQSQGYGAIGRKRAGKRIVFYAHRLAYEFVHEPIPAGHDVCHRCDNPPCCNPAHLFVGTRSENMRDAVTKGRHYSPFSSAERRRHGFAAGGPCK
jgi:hypothetical protein